MKEGGKRIWFPAKRYGWGWSFPVCWQGWVVLIVWLAVLMAGRFYFRPWHTLPYVAFVLGMAAILIGICYAKGEKPRWRWGGK